MVIFRGESFGAVTERKAGLAGLHRMLLTEGRLDEGLVFASAEVRNHVVIPSSEAWRLFLHSTLALRTMVANYT